MSDGVWNSLLILVLLWVFASIVVLAIMSLRRKK